MKKFRLKLQEIIDDRSASRFVRFNQSEFARAVGTSPAQISKLRSTPVASIVADLLYRMARELGVDPLDLLMIEESEEAVPAGA